MKRKLLAALLLAALILSVIPTTAAAETKTFGEMFPDVNFRSYVRSTVLADNSDPKGNSDIPTTAQMNIIKKCTEIDVSEYDITSLEGISNFQNLQRLNCSGNQLITLDLSKNSALIELWCYNNQLTELDVSKNLKLTFLNCNENQLTALNVSNNTALETLACWNNPITELDVTKNTEMEFLTVAYTQLTELNVSQNTKLDVLYCSDNLLTELDVSKNTVLTMLWCDNNFLTELDVSNNTEVYRLYCSGNQLTELNISMLPDLGELFCDNNLLTKLDTSANTNLYSLYCNGNQLRELDLSKNPGSYHNDIYSTEYILGPQSIRDTDAVVASVDGCYVLNLLKLAPGIDLSRVTMTDGGALNTRTGNLTYLEKPETISYSYETKAVSGELMEVQWTPIYEEDILEPGDVNQDHALNSADVVLLAKYLLGSVSLTDAQLNAADVNGDGAVTTADAVMLAKKLLEAN